MSARLGGAMSVSLAQFSKITSLILSASLDQSKWADCIEYISEVTDVRAHMFGHDLEANVSVSTLTKNYDPDFVKSYDEHYASINSWVPGFFEQKVGRTISSEIMCARDTLETTEFYNDWVLPQEDIIAGGGAILHKDATRMFVIGGNIRRKDQHKEKDWLSLVELITPHIQNALSINRAIAGTKIEKWASQTGINTTASAICLLDQRGKLLFANALAQEMIEGGAELRAGFNGSISFANVAGQRFLERALYDLNSGTTRISSYFQMFSKNQKSNLDCRTARFDPGHLDVSPFGVFTRTDEPCLLLSIASAVDIRLHSNAVLAGFGITAAERDIVLGVVEGCSLREIAEIRHVSINTVRNQLKSAMQKLNVRRQLDLAKFVE